MTVGKSTMKTVGDDISWKAQNNGTIGIHPCASCDVRTRAVCSALSNDELKELALHSRHRAIDAGETVFFEGDPTEAYYVVMDGALKLYKLLADGRRQITGFLFKGDFLGLAYCEDHSFSAEALKDSKLCQLPKGQFEAMADESGALGRRLLSIATSGVACAQEQMLLLGRKTAAERLASFLLWLSSAQGRGGDDSADLISVPMSRADMADYLGLTVETVSRTVTKFKTGKLIRLQAQNGIEICDRGELEAIAAGEAA
ncbi:cyclic nucleotide-binding domain-containing protein [Tepidicaulis sp. LMO-SS28]|uniref:cyclic nucleotide-binding domain-containing protein n=1 Tax=Tepidicaulis sp. LMO-SS28 TaxID=3447455 RepID=UPI003EE3E117